MEHPHRLSHLWKFQLNHTAPHLAKCSLKKNSLPATTDERNKKMTTAFAQHLTKHEHFADFGNTRILDIERGVKRRMTLESLRIQQQIDNAINFKEDVDNTNKVYAAVINNKYK
ncbi:PREDICTED: uncharacterized protein LOC108365750 [Rhagoletis zephyria]|uniref:uncharacterized protein LOC108365750 n=1 Tax=Rhagoletis zephyria TaxID=28612 RepID=UPI00081143E0|nr:PREDICTED: uncharacterized protein LOC108365750 [Rhagoletis zephyria]XP_036340548.1 uncharacterized protein LOC118749878 [Rhagoletis pomonella]